MLVEQFTIKSGKDGDYTLSSDRPWTLRRLKQVTKELIEAAVTLAKEAERVEFINYPPQEKTK